MNIFKTAFISTLVVALAVPTSLIARPFASDPEVRVYPDNETITFVETRVGETRTEYFTIENISNSSRNINVTSLPQAPFTLNSASNLEVTANSTRTLAVSFTPRVTGSFQSSFVIQNSATGETKTLSLSGSSVGQQQNLGIELSNTRLSFPRTLVGETAQTNVTVTNRNNYPVNITRALDSSDAQFQLSTAPTILNAGQSYTQTISFTPHRSGTARNSLTFRTIGTNTTTSHTVRLEAEGILLTSDNPELEIRANDTLNFQELTVGSSTYLSVSMKNNGTRTLTVNITRLADLPFISDLGGTNYHTMQITPGNSRNLRVQFTPRTIGTFRSQVTISTNSSNLATKTFNLIGTSVPSGTLPRPEPTPPTVTTSDYNPVTVTRSTINPDLNEIAYFNFVNSTRQNVNLEIYDNRNSQLIYTKNHGELHAGHQNFRVSWNGENFAQHKVSAGTYRFHLYRGSQLSTGTITVLRTPTSHQNYILYFQEDPYYARYNYTPPPVNREDLITGLWVTPKVLAQTAGQVSATFNLQYNGPVSATILNSRQEPILQLVKDRPLLAGHHREVLSWNGQLNGQPAPNGDYYFQISTYRLNEADADQVAFKIEKYPQAPTPVIEPKIKTTYYQSVLTNRNLCLDFVDVSNDNEFCNAVTLAIHQNIFTGGFNNLRQKTLMPDNYLTNAEAIVISLRLLGITPDNYNPNIDQNLKFKDLDPTQWYMPYYKTLLRLNTTTQYPFLKNLLTIQADQTVRPTQPINRETFYSAILESIKHSKNIKTNFTLASDNTQNLNLQLYLDFLQENIDQTNFSRKYFQNFKFTPQTFKGNQGLTRAEVIDFIYLLQTRNLINFETPTEPSAT